MVQADAVLRVVMGGCYGAVPRIGGSAGQCRGGMGSSSGSSNGRQVAGRSPGQGCKNGRGERRGAGEVGETKHRSKAMVSFASSLLAAKIITPSRVPANG